jgi:hypothetical protein
MLFRLPTKLFAVAGACQRPLPEVMFNVAQQWDEKVGHFTEE